MLPGQRGLARSGPNLWSLAMRIVSYLAATLGIAAIAYFSLRRASSQPQRPVAPYAQSVSNLDAQNGVARALIRQQQATQHQKSDLDQKMLELEARLANVEAKGKSEPTSAVDSDSSAERAPKRISEAEVAVWMDEALRAAPRDQNWVGQTTAQLEEALKGAPNVDLDEVECGNRFCRVTFSRQDAAPPDLRTLFGTPPFVTEGFTIDTPDGGVMMYFVRAGESLDGLRNEAAGIDLSEPATEASFSTAPP
jgi:hypothetical protein